MNPMLDQLLVGAIVASALGWFAWRALRRRSDGKGCASGCCSTKKPLV